MIQWVVQDTVEESVMQGDVEVSTARKASHSMYIPALIRQDILLLFLVVHAGCGLTTLKDMLDVHILLQRSLSLESD